MTARDCSLRHGQAVRLPSTDVHRKVSFTPIANQQLAKPSINSLDQTFNQSQPFNKGHSYGAFVCYRQHPSYLAPELEVLP